MKILPCDDNDDDDDYTDDVDVKIGGNIKENNSRDDDVDIGRNPGNHCREIDVELGGNIKRIIVVIMMRNLMETSGE